MCCVAARRCQKMCCVAARRCQRMCCVAARRVEFIYKDQMLLCCRVIWEHSGMFLARASVDGACDDANCTAVTANIECPSDSRAVAAAVSRDDPCCPLPPHCQCLDCGHSRLTCPDGHIRVISRQGQGVPGQCCALYECQPKGTYILHHFRVIPEMLY